MIDGAFLQGTLEMPQSITEMATAGPVWESILLNRILALAAAVLLLVVITDTIMVLPRLLNCITRWRASISLEHSLSDARPRNAACAVMMLVLALVCDKYGLFCPRFAELVPQGIRVLVCIGAVASFFLLRTIIYGILDFGRMRADERKAVFGTLCTFAVLLGILELCTCGLLELFGTSANGIRMVLLCETGLLWTISFIRTAQILGSHFSGLTTFLYLCALEILPAAAVVVCQTVL